MKVFRTCSKSYAIPAVMFIGACMFSGHRLLQNRPEDPTSNVVYQKPDSYSAIRKQSWKSIFDDVIHPDKLNCDALLNDPDRDEDFYSRPYLEHRRKFQAVLRRVTGTRPVEGNSGNFESQLRLYYYLARQPWVSTICEIGFNAGHSTLQWLAGNDKAIVYSFDIGEHGYTRPMFTYLQRRFPGRLNVTIGDSRKTIPRFSATNRHVKCDLVIVDGGHTYDIALADLINMRALANADHNVLVFDDYLSTFGGVYLLRELGVPWNKMRADGFVVERYACTLGQDKNRGFVVGYYV